MQLRRNHGQQQSPDDERAILREQRDALESLRRQLAERVQAVEARERELREAIAQARAGNLPTQPTAPPGHDVDAAVRARLAEVERRERAVADRERALETADETTAERPGDALVVAELRAREQALAAREEELARREAELAAGEPSSETASAEPLNDIERRLAELRDAEALFLRTRQELADRSEAVAARERLVAQRERELDEREDGAWNRSEVAELEARLRRLEQHDRRAADVEQTQGFSGGFRRLQEEGTRRPGSGESVNR